MNVHTQILTAPGPVVVIRRLRITDTAMESEFIRKLSPKSKHCRFLGGNTGLSTDQIRLLCDGDKQHSMAFVATIEKDGQEKEIAVSRYAANAHAGTRVVAITVADAWQPKGLGTQMVNQFIDFARRRGIRQLYSVDVADNVFMHELAEDLGMTAKRDPQQSKQTVYSLAL